MELYSVLNPPTSSCSASTRSNGGRLSSAVPAITKITKGTRPVTMMAQLGTKSPQPAPGLVLDDPVGGEGAGLEDHGHHRQAHGRLVGDHLGRRPHRPEQRVLGPRRPAGQHHAVHRDRRHGQGEQDADGRVGHLHEGGVAEDVDDPVVVAVEVPADGDDGEQQEGRDERQERRQHEHAALGPVRDEVLLEEELDAVGQGLEHAEGAGQVGSDTVLHVRHELALEPDHQHGGQQQQHEDDDHLGHDHGDDAPLELARQHRILGEDHCSPPAVSTRTSVTWAVASISDAAWRSAWLKNTAAAPRGSPASAAISARRSARDECTRT